MKGKNPQAPALRREAEEDWGKMKPKATRYREYAERCRELAKKAEGQKKQRLEIIAAAWERCAAEVEVLKWPRSARGLGT